ncbi:MAG TPA: 4a-hydroxytetrahydrobiopterin dehydratase [Nevskiaceae bacterium]|nr:4a-hydroxytetrahydrobiopterin dehydratase [Nevskiaceae bacterium]
MTELASRRCIPCEGGVKPHDLAAATRLKQGLRPEWEIVDQGKGLRGTFGFRNYYHTQAFVNAVAYIAHREDHHPDISFGYKTCTVHWSTHSIDGLSDNDFICAAKVDALLAS